MLQEVPGSVISIGDRVHHEDYSPDEVFVVVFIPHSETHDMFLCSELTGKHIVVDFGKLRHSDKQPPAKLSGWAVLFEDGHTEFWQHDPGGLYGEQIAHLKISGTTPVEVTVHPFTRHAPTH